MRPFGRRSRERGHSSSTWTASSCRAGSRSPVRPPPSPTWSRPVSRSGSSRTRRSRHGGRPPGAACGGPTLPPLPHSEADAGRRADAVVVGDSEDQLTYENLNRAFRQVRAGAAFVAMHRNPWRLTAAGPTLDSGALVVGLEYATGRRG